MTINTYIIAEIGVNHNNSFHIAKKLVNLAKKAGADAVKFQTFSAENLAQKYTSKVSYQKKNATNKQESHFQMLKNLEFSKENHLKIFSYCKKKKIDFISTPYDVDSAKFLNKLNVKFFKVASADLIDHKLHNYLSKTNKKVIISTGMATIGEIYNTLKIYSKKKKIKNIALMHCVSNYPCKDNSLNLLNIRNLIDKFNLKVGFSDHSTGFIPSGLSIALGARIIEKHLTVSNNMKGPDHKASLNGKNFIKFVKNIRNVENILGSYNKKIQPEELEMKKISRKALYYSRDLNKGTILKENDIKPLRPPQGILANNFFYFLGKKLISNVRANKKLNFNHVKKK